MTSRWVAFDLAAAMASSGLRIADVMALTGKSRVTVWRWRRAGAVPPHVRRLLAQQSRIRALSAEVVDARSRP